MEELTIISAITRGCLIGFKTNANARVIKRTMQIWMMSNGRAKCMGTSPCHTPFDVADIVLHVPLVTAMILRVHTSQECLQLSSHGSLNFSTPKATPLLDEVNIN